MALALTVYPTEGYNSFVDQTTFEDIAQYYIEYDKYTSLSDDDKIRYITTGFKVIVNTSGVQIPVSPDESTECLPETQVAIVMHDLKYDISATTSNVEVKSEKVGSLKVEYFEGAISAGTYPTEALPCLEGLGMQPSGSVHGVGSMPKVR